MPEPRIVAWRPDREGAAGHDVVRLVHEDGAHRAEGCCVSVGLDGDVGAVRYSVVADDAWRTRSAVIEVVRLEAHVRLRLDGDGEGRWWIDGRPCPELEGCLDVDLAATPFTNTLPIRRLALGTGAEAEARAVWVAVDGRAIEPLDQLYRRLAGDRYLYRALDSGFEAELTVDEDGLVVDYPGIGRRVGVAAATR